eukprot:929933-Pyramimonas_sp.AAC.1
MPNSSKWTAPGSRRRWPTHTGRTRGSTSAWTDQRSRQDVSSSPRSSRSLVVSLPPTNVGGQIASK